MFNCPKSEEVDFDGMSLAPKEVLETSAWAVFRCAINQARTWKPPSKNEKLFQGNMLEAFAESKINGISKKTTDIILENADKLGLQVMRVRKDSQKDSKKDSDNQKDSLDDSVDDSFLLIFTKPGVKDYNGPFFMLRETKSSKVILLVPHDLNDGTHSDTKLALANSSALAVISNGHNKGIDPKADFVDHSNTLGSIALRQLQDLFPKPVVLMIHGKKGSKSIQYNSRSKELGKVFKNACIKTTNIKNYGKFNADYATDRIVRTEYYLKTEIPAQIHVNNQKALMNVVKTIEEYDWAWDSEIHSKITISEEIEEDIDTTNDCEECEEHEDSKKDL